jgi:hypothetical protein
MAIAKPWNDIPPQIDKYAHKCQTLTVTPSLVLNGGDVKYG